MHALFGISATLSCGALAAPFALSKLAEEGSVLSGVTIDGRDLEGARRVETVQAIVHERAKAKLGRKIAVMVEGRDTPALHTTL